MGNKQTVQFKLVIQFCQRFIQTLLVIFTRGIVFDVTAIEELCQIGKNLSCVVGANAPSMHYNFHEAPLCMRKTHSFRWHALNLNIYIKVNKQSSHIFVSCYVLWCHVFVCVYFLRIFEKNTLYISTKQ